MLVHIVSQYPLAIGFLFYSVFWLLSVKPKHRLPPGPIGVPILGNFFDIPKVRWWLQYEEWWRKYRDASDLIHLRILGTHIIIVNSTKAARDLFEKRSRNYSDKVHSIMINELTGWDRNMAFMRYSDSWRAHRRMFHQFFRPEAIPTYHSTMLYNVRRNLSLFLDEPDGFMQHLRLIAGSTVLNVVYGIVPEGGSDPRIKAVEDAVHTLSLIATAGAYLVDYLPILKYIPAWLPGATFKRQAQEWKPIVDEMFMGSYRDTKAEYDKGSAKPSILAAIFNSTNKNELNDELQNQIINVTGLAYAAGTDTTVATLAAFVQIMLLFPEVQITAQAELDSVVGRDRLPDLDDRDNLPYVSALFKETMRWHPILPLGVAHRSIEDDEYEGCHIPAGSIVIGNVWTILHEEDRYPDPYAFNPRRFLTQDGKLDPTVPDPTEAFGFSRRICAGRYFAQDLGWLAIAHILCAFKLEKPLDEHGQTIEPSGKWVSGLICFPEPFKVAFKSRSAELESIVYAESTAQLEE